jgi:hypothetical protein
MSFREAAKAATVTATAMASQPLAIALLIVNIGFLAFAGYVLGEVSANARDRNTNQMTLIARMVEDIRECRQGILPPAER